jgi:hypothetical protein
MPDEFLEFVTADLVRMQKQRFHQAENGGFVDKPFDVREGQSYFAIRAEHQVPNDQIVAVSETLGKAGYIFRYAGRNVHETAPRLLTFYFHYCRQTPSL